MKIAIVSGSHRVQSQSKKVAQFIIKMLKADFPAVESYYLDLGIHPLPEWDESKWENSDDWRTQWSPVSSELTESSAFIAISPEWGGMVPSRLKNFFLLCDQNELAHKPGLIVTVSSGRGEPIRLQNSESVATKILDYCGFRNKSLSKMLKQC